MPKLPTRAGNSKPVVCSQDVIIPNERNIMAVDIGFEFLMSFVFGWRGHHGTAGNIPAFRWKKHLLKLFRTLKSAIHKNVTGDDRHMEYMMERCDTAIGAIRSAKFKDEISCKSLQFAFELLFELLGHYPQNWQSRRAHHSRVTDLASYRTLSYTRTATQKVRQITDAAYANRNDSTGPSFEVLIEKLKHDFSGNPHKFLAWLRSEHRMLYDRFI
jgi:hypothetical protein